MPDTPVASKPLQPAAIVSSVPVPDPTTLTNELVSRANNALQALIEARLRGIDADIERLRLDAGEARKSLKDIIETRLNGMDKAHCVLQDTVYKSDKEFKLYVELAISQLKALHEEKFRGIDNRFIELYSRIEQTARDSKVAVDAAFAAAKEAVGEQNKSNALSITKSEAATTKQIDLINDNLRTTVKNTDDKFGDLKDRITSIESNAQGKGAITGPIWAVVAAVAASVITLGITLIVSQPRGQAPVPPVIYAPAAPVGVAPHQ